MTTIVLVNLIFIGVLSVIMLNTLSKYQKQINKIMEKNNSLKEEESFRENLLKDIEKTIKTHSSIRKNIQDDIVGGVLYNTVQQNFNRILDMVIPEEGKIIELPKVLKSGWVRGDGEIHTSSQKDKDFIMKAINYRPESRCNILLYPCFEDDRYYIGYTNLIPNSKLSAYNNIDGKGWFESISEYRILSTHKDSCTIEIEPVNKKQKKKEKKRIDSGYIMYLYENRVKPKLSPEEIEEFESRELFSKIKLLKEGLLAVTYTMNSKELEKFVDELMIEFQSYFKNYLKQEN